MLPIADVYLASHRRNSKLGVPLVSEAARNVLLIDVALHWYVVRMKGL